MPNQEGLFPLLYAFEIFRGEIWSEDQRLQFKTQCQWSEYPSVIDWFLDKKASTTYVHTHLYLNILFYLAIKYSDFSFNVPGALCEQFERLISRSASLCNPLGSDTCGCYCSPTGCHPLHMLSSCLSERMRTHACCESSTNELRFNGLKRWLSLCHVRESELLSCCESFCRLEVFDRLGMAHTCCRYKTSWISDRSSIPRRSPMPEEDRKRVHDEDTLLKDQLQLIMQAYQNKCNHRWGDLEDYSKEWWGKLDEILPELSPEERCEHRCLNEYHYWTYSQSKTFSKDEQAIHDRRIQTEKEALIKQGYYGLDFLDVIRLHFAEELALEEPEQAIRIPENDATEQGDTTIGVPQSMTLENEHDASSLVRDFGRGEDSGSGNCRLERRRSV